MALTKLTENLDVIQKLDDEPNDVDGLSAAELKAKFDKAGNAIKNYINNTLTPEVDAQISNLSNGKVNKTTTVNGHALSGDVTVTKSDVGLGSVNNTSDADKPISTKQQVALDLKADKSNVLQKDNTTEYAPASNYHPATKKYVDDTVGGIAVGQLPDNSIVEGKLVASIRSKLNGSLQRSGGIMEGDLRVLKTPIQEDSAASKHYVDNKVLPVGAIVMWSGTETNIPEKWALCNGKNGTPDLRDRFVVGAGNSYAAGATGGSNTVTLTTNQIPSHRHEVHMSISSGSSDKETDLFAVGSSSVRDHAGYSRYTGGGQAHENRPPYYALCFIMYLGA